MNFKIKGERLERERGLILMMPSVLESFGFSSEGGGITGIIDFFSATSFGASTRVLVRVLEVPMAL